MTLNCVVVDDSAIQRLSIVKLIENHSSLNLIAEWLLGFVNEQGKLLPRRLTGTSLKYQRKVSVAVKRARHLALMPYVADLLK